MNLKVIVTFLGAVVLITASVFFPPSSAQVARPLISPPPHLAYFSFGQQMTMADGMWIRAIQDFDYCDQEISKNVCRGQNWLFHMLDEITSLAPDYLTAYREGGMALSVVISDIDGASHILDKGLAVIRNDWNFYYRGAYHALFEEKNKKKAAERFLAAAKLQGLKGEWFYNIASRLFYESGQNQLALEIYQDMKKQGLDERLLQRMREKLKIQE